MTSAKEVWAQYRVRWHNGMNCIRLAERVPIPELFHDGPVPMDATFTCYTYGFERMGWHHADGHDTEWVQVTCNGEIIDAINVTET